METPSLRRRKRSFDDQARIILLLGVMLLAALSLVVYAWTKEPAVFFVNQALAVLVGHYFPKANA